ncbi:hypothetical protein ICM05_09935 [Leucobacter sp. cx-42]|uniref:hypothetical protein n=1 Tax=unclassified Leucobacter TaxID=2621730 RepID=UPI00165E93F3|nr:MULTISPECIES: hypothetical protein [unclassified Leucobacter]MBC9954957.1 hypothetical protein [Leucobacter sp. cx-42]
MADQKVRTFVAAFVGVLIARLVVAIPVISDTFALVDGIFAEAGYAGLSTLALVQAATTAVVVLLYVQLAQWLGDRWPSVEKVMLGSDARPSYEPRYAQ